MESGRFIQLVAEWRPWNPYINALRVGINHAHAVHVMLSRFGTRRVIVSKH